MVVIFCNKIVNIWFYMQFAVSLQSGQPAMLSFHTYTHCQKENARNIDEVRRGRRDLIPMRHRHHHLVDCRYGDQNQTLILGILQQR